MGALADSLTDKKNLPSPKSVKNFLPNEIITAYDSLDIVPDDGEFFLPHNFYSSLKDTTMSNEEYENVKKCYKTMKLANLGELNKICNFQDAIILCEIFQQGSSCLQEILNLILVNVILEVDLVAVYIGKQVSVVLPFQLTLNMSDNLIKH